MKAKDLRERTTEDLAELKATMSKDLFSHKMKNFTGQLDDTSLINKTRKDIARIELLLSERAAKGAKS
ncbi:MAG: 50S ribosomal protein L29 [Myxococcales bacterium]|jgi:large subunit ribosomal protein L29